MKKPFKLSETELQIMNTLWQLPEPSSLNEIMDFLNERLNKSWKQQTVGTYLSHLEQAGLVSVDKRFARLHLYFPACTKEEYMQNYLKNLVETSFDNSIANLVAAFTGGQKLSEKDAEEIRKLI